MQVQSNSNETVDDDRQYDVFLANVQRRFAVNIDNGKRPLFTTNVAGLFEAYLSALPADRRQYSTCNCCRHFIERFGGLVTIDETGRTDSALWLEDDATDYYAAGVSAMLKLVRKAKVTGVFKASETVWGTASSPKSAKHGGDGNWSHFHLVPPVTARHQSRIQTAYQCAAEKLEDRGQVARALGEYTAEHLDVALKLLKSDTLYRSEKVLGPAEWLAKLHADRASAKGKDARENVLWLAVATAPAGFCHPRSSMIGTLLDDIASGKGYDDVARAFKAKMHPLSYQRPQAAPSAGTIAQAEKLVEQLGIASSLRRRFARIEEVLPFAQWAPKAIETKPASGGVFSHLAPKDKVKPVEMELPATTMTWDKFERTVLADAMTIEVYAPYRGNYTAILTASDPESPPILQWDHAENRNPFSLYVWHGGSTSTQWGLSVSWVNVSAIVDRPAHWTGTGLPNQSHSTIMLLEGARESRDAGLALFPETLKSELHGVRAVIEAHSKAGRLEGMAEGSACGLLFEHSGAWDARLRVTTKDGRREYRIDRND
ncbi:MAG TPA: hypothetical protein VGK73_31595 [Polyangiaceae bacterium]